MTSFLTRKRSCVSNCWFCEGTLHLYLRNFAQGAMASVIDSEAHFNARAAEMGMSNDLKQALKDNGILTLSHLAFAIGQPSSPLSNDEISGFLRPLLTREATIQEVSVTKRFTFEAQTFLVAVLRQGLEQPDD